MIRSNKLKQAYYERKYYKNKLEISFYSVKGKNNHIHVK